MFNCLRSWKNVTMFNMYAHFVTLKTTVYARFKNNALLMCIAVFKARQDASILIPNRNKTSAHWEFSLLLVYLFVYVFI